jgi:hypothetical protein
MFAMVTAYFAFVRGGGLRAIAARSTPALVTLVLAVIQLRVSRGLTGANMQTIGNAYGLDPLERLQILPGAVFGGYDSTRLAIIAVVWLAALVANAVAKGKPSSRQLAARVAFWRYRYPVLAAVFFFMFLGFPMSLGGTTLLAHRFLPAACVFLIAACAPRSTSAPRAMLLVLVPLAMLGIQMKSFVETSQRFRELDEVIAHLPDNVAVAQLDLTPRAAGLVAPVPGAASRAQSEHGGRMLFALTDMPPNPIYIRPSQQWNEPILRLASTPYAFMPAYDGQRFSYVLARGGLPAYRALAARALAPEFELVFAKGEWALFRSTLPVEPIDSPDRPLPSPPPEMLITRMNRLLSRDPTP